MLLLNFWFVLFPGEYSCTDDPHRLAVEMKDRRSHRHGNRPLKDDPTFQTFVPRLHPSFNTQTQVKPSFIRPIKEQELPLQEKRKSRNLSIGSIDDPLQVKRNSIGKRVTFANEGLTQRNLQNLERILHTSNHIPPTNKLAFLCDSSELSKTGSDVTFANGGSWYPRVPRSHDDDDNTTTSGSYTLNPEDIDEMFCETYPVSWTNCDYLSRVVTWGFSRVYLFQSLEYFACYAAELGQQRGACCEINTRTYLKSLLNLHFSHDVCLKSTSEIDMEIMDCE